MHARYFAALVVSIFSVPVSAVPGDFTHTILPPPGSGWFGIAATVVGPDRILVGAPLAHHNGAYTGAVYLHDFQGNQIRLIGNTSSSPARNDNFGRSIAAHGPHFLVGADGDDDSGTDAGIAYLIDGQSPGISVLETFHNPQPASSSNFGWVASNGERIFISARGHMGGEGVVYVYDGETYQLIDAIPNPDPAGRFGAPMFAWDNYLAVCAPYTSDGGKVHLYDTRTLQLLESFSTPSSDLTGEFGSSVHGRGDQILIGALREDDVHTDSGAAYLFSTEGDLLAEFHNPSGDSGPGGGGGAGDIFGTNVLLLEQHAVISAVWEDDPSTDSGIAYLFDIDGTLVRPIPNPASSDWDNFGQALVAGDEFLFIGSRGEDAAGDAAGALHAFEAPATPGILDLQWTADLPSPLAGRGLAVDGQGDIYVSAESNGRVELHALDRNGDERWRVDRYGTQNFISDPVVGLNGVEEQVYVSVGYGWPRTGSIHAYSTEGRPLWSRDLTDIGHPHICVGENGTIFVYGYWSDVVALEPSGGETLWTWSYPKKGSVQLTFPGIAASPELLIFGDLSNEIYAVAAETGTTIWRETTTHGFVNGVAIDEERSIYLALSTYSGTGGLLKLNRHGEEQWHFPVGGRYALGPAIGADGTVYVGSPDGHLHAIDPDGWPHWSSDLEVALGAPAVGEDGTIYVAQAVNRSQSPTLFAVTPSGEDWESAPLNLYTHPHAVPRVTDDGRLYVATAGLAGKVYAFDVPSRGLADSPWPMLFHDIQGTNYSGNEPEHPPQIASLSDVSLEAGRTLRIPVRAIDHDGDDIRFELGSVTPTFVSLRDDLDGTGSLTITPGPSDVQEAPYTVAVVASDTWLLDVEEFGLTVLPHTNHPPVASPDSYETDEDRVLMVSAPGVLANDTDVDEDQLSVSVVSPPDHGVLELANDGGFTYTPNADYNGADGFTYAASDGHLAASAPVSLTVQAVNDLPLAVITPLQGPLVEGVQIEFDAGESNDDRDAGNGGFVDRYYWDFGDGTDPADASEPGYTHTYDDDGDYTVRLRVRDDGPSYSVEAILPIIVANASPEVTLLPPSDFILPGVPTTFEGLFSDLGRADTHTGLWEFGDDESGPGTLAEESGSGAIRATHTYRDPGLYSVRAVVTDSDGDSGEDALNAIVLSQDDAADHIADRVESLPDLPKGLRNSLTSKLAAASDAFARGRAETAVNQLGAFINALEAQSGKKISQEDADALIALAQQLIASGGGAPTAAANGRKARAKMTLRTSPVDGESFGFGLEQNLPNPFNPLTSITYSLAERASVHLAVYNAVGQRTRVLVDGIQATGRHTVTWDGRDDAGRRVASGLYLYRLTAGPESAVRKMLFAR